MPAPSSIVTIGLDFQIGKTTSHIRGLGFFCNVHRLFQKNMGVDGLWPVGHPFFLPGELLTYLY
jgi:hypothetical protein